MGSSSCASLIFLTHFSKAQKQNNWRNLKTQVKIFTKIWKTQLFANFNYAHGPPDIVSKKNKHRVPKILLFLKGDNNNNLPACVKCQKAFGVGDLAVAAPRFGARALWHPMCFTCTTCNEPLVRNLNNGSPSSHVGKTKVKPYWWNVFF